MGIGQSIHKVLYGFRHYETQLCAIFGRILGEERLAPHVDFSMHVQTVSFLCQWNCSFARSPVRLPTSHGTYYVWIMYARVNGRLWIPFRGRTRSPRWPKLQDEINGCSPIGIAAAILCIRLFATLLNRQTATADVCTHVAYMLARVRLSLLLSRCPSMYTIILFHAAKQSDPANCRNSANFSGEK